MNKFAKVMCMIAVVALAFTACKKKENTVQSFVLNGTTEEFENIYDEFDGEKAYIDGSKVKFEVNDELMVFNMNTTSPHAAIYTFDGTNFNSTTGVNPDTDGAFYAFYPAGNVINPNSHLNDGYATFRLNASQVYRTISDKPVIPANSLYMAAKDETATNLDNANFSFKNICGILSMKFFSTEDRHVTSIEVTDKTFNIVGDVQVDLDKVNPDELTTWFRNYSEDATYQANLATYLHNIGYHTTSTGPTIILDCTQENADGVLLGKTKAKATQFLVVMRPLALLKGCNITINFKENVEPVVIKSTKDNRISPNVIRNMTATKVG